MPITPLTGIGVLARKGLETGLADVLAAPILNAAVVCLDGAVAVAGLNAGCTMGTGRPDFFAT